MRKLTVFFSLLVSLLFLAGAAQAQVAPVFGDVRVNVPFEFHAGNTIFPAGTYLIKRLNEDDPRVLTIQPTTGKITSLIIVHLSDTLAEAKTSAVIFNKYGKRYFLSSINVAGYSNAAEADKSPYEVMVAKGEVQGEGRRIPAELPKK